MALKKGPKLGASPQWLAHAVQPQANVHIDEHGRTPAHYAALKGNKKKLRALLGSWSLEEVGIADYEGHTILHFAAAQGDPGLVRSILDVDEQQVMARDRQQCLPLHYAAENDSPFAASALLGRERKHVMHQASQLALKAYDNVVDPQQTELVQVAAQDNEGATALHVAVARQYFFVMEVLLQNMTEEQVMIRDARSRTFFDVAMEAMKPKDVDRIISMMTTEQVEKVLQADRHGHCIKCLRFATGCGAGLGKTRFSDTVSKLLSALRGAHLDSRSSSHSDIDSVLDHHRDLALKVCEYLEAMPDRTVLFDEVVLAWILYHSLQNPDAPSLSSVVLDVNTLAVDPPSTLHQHRGHREQQQQHNPFRWRVGVDPLVRSSDAKEVQKWSDSTVAKLHDKVLSSGCIRPHKASLMGILLCPVALFSSERLLRALAETQNHGVFKNVVARAMVCHAWQHSRKWFLLEVMLMRIPKIVVLMILSGSAHEPDPYPWWAILWIFIYAIMEFLGKSRELFYNARREVFVFCHVWDWLIDNAGSVGHWLVLGLQIWGCGVISIYRDFKDEDLRVPALTALASIASWSWLQGLWALRPFRPLGPQMLPVVYVLKRVWPFFVVMAFALAASVHAFCVIGGSSYPSRLYAAIRDVYRLAFLGDFDLVDLEGVKTVLTTDGNNPDVWAPRDPRTTSTYTPLHTWFYITTVGVSLVLVNFLVAVVVSNYSIYGSGKKAEAIFMQTRAQMVLDHQTSLLGKLFHHPLLPDDYHHSKRSQQPSFLPVIHMKGDFDNGVDTTTRSSIAMQAGIKDDIREVIKQTMCEISDGRVMRSFPSD